MFSQGSKYRPELRLF